MTRQVLFLFPLAMARRGVVHVLTLACKVRGGVGTIPWPLKASHAFDLSTHSSWSERGLYGWIRRVLFPYPLAILSKEVAHVLALACKVCRNAGAIPWP